MKLGFVGLGRMGGNMLTRLLQGGHSVVAHEGFELLAALRHKFGGHPVRRG